MPRKISKDTVKEWTAAASGAGVGAAVGSSIGIAVGAIGAISGALPLALILGVIGWGGTKIVNQREANKRLEATIDEEISKTL
jgi:hypothetical protein